MDSPLEDSVFDDGDGSDFGSPAPKPKVTKAKATTTSTAKRGPKAAVKRAPKADAQSKKKATQTTLKVKPAAKKRRKAESEDENEDASDLSEGSKLSTTPPQAKRQKKAPTASKMASKPLREIENEAMNEIADVSMALDGSTDVKPKKGSKATDQYQKLTQLEHIIKRPDTYIGSVEMQEHKMWVYNSDLESMELRTVNFVPGLYKIFDEILVNAADNKQRDKNMDTMKVTVDRETGEISVYNNGRGIPVEIHDKEKIYIPEMIFGHLLTSSNYDDEEQKVTGGRNGYGAKLCNIFSTSFKLETADAKSKKSYKQTWVNNMGNMGNASIASQKGDDYTRITFTPDYRKFGMRGIDDDFEALVKRRVHDLAGTVKGIKVWLNGERVKVNNFKKYMEMYTKAIKRERGPEAANDGHEIVVDTPDARWEIGFAVSDGTFQQVSFVNSIATTTGGTHVNYIADQVCNHLLEVVKKRKNNKVASLKPAQIRNHIFVFVNCLIVNPAFTSQTKEQLTTKQSQFGSKCNLSAEFLKKVQKTEVVENILHFAEQKADQILKKSDGAKRSRMDNPKLTDANRAGTKDGWECTLILTEGDSAKGLAIAGRAVVSPDKIGVYPLRGKLLNVRDASIEQISKNQEIQNIKNFLGLKHKQTYTDCKSMRYGHLMIMTDQDHDGSHIKGLLINFFQVHYPSLLKIPGFLVEFITPIVKAYKGDPKHPKAEQAFFTMPEYEAFKEAHKGEKWEHKYYKGLGTSTTLEAQVYFRDLDKHLKAFQTMRDEEVQLIELAFSKKKADERKEWLRQFKPGTYLDHSERTVSYTNFINKELILFSVADNMRSIPSVVDGFKPGQRKVLFTCFKRNLKKDTKVVELAGAVSGLTAYQHGDTSLQGTIVGLAQNFVGSNNINCLEPSGNFGSRLQGGSDCASARYIYTRLCPIARKIFHTADEPLLTYNTDDERKIEPEVYVPVVPMILVNGADGIGTGWSTTIPNYNPEDIVENLHLLMEGQPMKPMAPWFRDFKGEVTPMGLDKYKFSGIIEEAGDNEIEITELPVRVWTQDFKDKIVEIIKAEKTPAWIKDYDDYNTHKDVRFVIRMEDKHMKSALAEGLEERFKLAKTMSTTNLVAFDAEGRITKYAGVEDIMKEFYAIRIKFYEKRKAHQLSEMRKEHEKLTNQARFIKMIVDGKLVVSKKKKAALVQELQAKGFKAIPKTVDPIKEGELAPIADNDEDEEAEDVDVHASSFDYLLGMAIWSLTLERVEKLLKQLGDIEVEIDQLIKMSKENLWKADLKEFIEEWRFMLEDERKSQRKVANMGRRASAKIRVGGAASRKRKGHDNSDDSDFDEAPKAKKAAASKVKGGLLGDYLGIGAAKAAPAPKTKGPSAAASKAQKLLEMLDNKPKPAPKVEGSVEDDVWMQIDGAGAGPSKAIKPKAPAPMRKPEPFKKSTISLDDESADEEIVRAKGSRKPRVAAAKAVKYNALSDSDSEAAGGDFDFGNMVKGIDRTIAGTDSSRPLFTESASRPSSSHGYQKRPTSSGRPTLDITVDDTDYSRLAPPSPNKGGIVTARQTIVSDDEDSFDNIPAAKIPQARAKPELKLKSKAKAVPKPAPAAAPLKKTLVLSPAAKAYASKKFKAEKAAKEAAKDDFDVDDVANEILDDDDEEPQAPARGRIRRAAAAAPKKVYQISEDEDDEDDFDAGGDEDTADFDESYD